MHGDLKPTNVYYQDMDGNGCPINVKLADFGLTFRLQNHRGERNKVKKFARSHFDKAGNIPGVCFRDSPAFPQGLEVNHDYYYASEVVDECSLAWMMQVVFELDVSANLRPGTDCGPMGAHRRHAIFAPAILNEPRVELGPVSVAEPNPGPDPMSRIGAVTRKRVRAVRELELQSQAAFVVAPAMVATNATLTAAIAAAAETATAAVAAAGVAAAAAAEIAGAAAKAVLAKTRKRACAVREPGRELHGVPARVPVTAERIPRGQIVVEHDEQL